MPSLNWIGKSAVVKHHKDVPYRLLEPVPELSCGDADSGNLIVQGDNLHALKALLPRYAGQVKCIYIDPPYNTGVDDRDESGNRTGWIYSDNVNSPEIAAWLGKVVGAEAEDLSRHDKWLCMMYPRLTLLKQFLRDARPGERQGVSPPGFCVQCRTLKRRHRLDCFLKEFVS